ncbi:MAG: hypothetical protein IJQ31_10905 [Thermoguttaceae bacterium]|nr:hypothetical protein [Thermoguttaceae bacterium]
MNPQPPENVRKAGTTERPAFFHLRLTPRGFNPAVASCDDPRKGKV